MHAVCAQAFHTLYHTDENALLGAPTGSGKTISAELAMLRVFRCSPGAKVVYIAPLKVSQVSPGGDADAVNTPAISACCVSAAAEPVRCAWQAPGRANEHHHT